MAPNNKLDGKTREEGNEKNKEKTGVHKHSYQCVAIMPCTYAQHGRWWLDVRNMYVHKIQNTAVVVYFWRDRRHLEHHIISSHARATR